MAANKSLRPVSLNCVLRRAVDWPVITYNLMKTDLRIWECSARTRFTHWHHDGGGLFLVPMFAMVLALDVLRAEDSRSPNVVVIVDAAASKLERYAAKEICGYLDKLYGIGATG